MAAPDVQHNFIGDSKLLNATLTQRTEIRKALTGLLFELQRLEGHPVQVQADIKFNVLGPTPKEHIYSVSVTDANFDSNYFARNKTPASRNGTGGAASSPASNHHDRRPSSVSSSRRGNEIDEPPFKRVRADGDDGPGLRSRDNGSISEQSTDQRVNEVLTYVKTWHDEWTAQGGWLFDTLNAVSKATKETNEAVDKKLDTVQDILGQSINSACASTMSELSNITKLLPWLEHCRKTNADKVQAREEKWRSSSATFHDQSRRDREAAERKLEEKLESQRQLLIKIAEANGIDIEEEDKRSEASLGAQLTAELNMEAARHGGDSRKNSTQEPISID